jgi:GT2 family glycosyltransferase/glycosyltransferase involved in cell wall biosynthesis
MKIVLASHHFPPDRLGGVELVTLKTAHWLQGHGHTVEVVAIERATEGAPDRVEARADAYQGVPVVRLTIDLFAPGVPWEWRYRHPVIEAWFRRHLQGERPDVAHIQSCYLLSAGAIHAARDAGCATVASLHDYWFVCPRLTMLRPDGSNCDGSRDPCICSWCLMTERRRYRYLDAVTHGLVGRAIVGALRRDGAARVLADPARPAALARRRQAVRDALERADVLVAPSPYVRDLLREEGFGPDRVRLVAPGLVLGTEAKAGRDDASPPYARRFAYLGQVIPSKGLDVLLRAFLRLRASCREATLHVYGGSPDLSYERRLRRLAGERDGVYWHGRYAPEEVWPILRSVDIVVVPSLWREIGPLVMLEALAAGRPVVASDLPNMHDAVRHEGNGLLFQPGSVASLERQLRRLTDEGGLVARLRAGIGPPRTVEDEMAELMAVYRKASALAHLDGREAMTALRDGNREPAPSLPSEHVSIIPRSVGAPEAHNRVSGARADPPYSVNPLAGGRRGRTGEAPPLVCIVVVNWNAAEDTLSCLESLRRVDYPSFEVVVVDNGSTDDSATVIRRQHPEVTVLEAGRNLGFTGGSNLALRWALERGADYALLLNNDTDVSAGFLTLIVGAAESDPRIAIASPLILYHDRPDTIWSAGGRIDWRHGSAAMIGLNEPDAGQFGGAPRDVDFVTGCALLVKAEVMRRVGLLDERFFMYYEDTEWCVRAQRAGYCTVVVPQARIWHKISPVAREASPRVHYLMTRNRLLFLRATRAGISSWLYTLFGDYARTLVSWSVRPRWRSKRPQRRAMVQAILDAGRGRWGAYAGMAGR